MSFFHSLGVPHREAKLDNKLLTGDAARPIIKVNDFTYRCGWVGGRLWVWRCEGDGRARLCAPVLAPLPPLTPPPPPPAGPCPHRSKSEQINSDPISALGSLPYTAPEVLSNMMQARVGVGVGVVWGGGGEGRGRCGVHALASVPARVRGAWGSALVAAGWRRQRAKPPGACAHRPLARASPLPPALPLPPSASQHGHPADVWSLGVGLYKMCVGMYPFEVRDREGGGARARVGRWRVAVAGALRPVGKSPLALMHALPCA